MSYAEMVEEARREIDGNGHVTLTGLALVLVELRLLREQIRDGVCVYQQRDD